jgi:hypothetical protein
MMQAAKGKPAVKWEGGLIVKLYYRLAGERAVHTLQCGDRVMRAVCRVRWPDMECDGSEE